jgi:hypothetical protein
MMRAKILACLLATGAVASAQKPADLAEKARQAQAVAEATAEADVAEAIKNAKKLAATFPDKALRDLKALSLKLDTQAGLSNTKREALIATVSAASTAISGGTSTTTTKKTDLPPEVIARIEKSRKVVDAADAETKDVQTRIMDIAKDVEAGRDREAKAKAADLAKLYPNNPVAIEIGLHSSFREGVLAAKDISTRSAEGFRLAMNSVQESAIPVNRDMTFPKDWKEKMERRRLMNAPKLTATEKKLVESLATPIKNELRNAPFEEAIQQFSSTIDQKIFLDKKSLEDKGVDLRSTVNVPGGVTARSALRVMLQQQGLTYIIRDNIIQVVSIEEASKVLVTRAYDVRDLVGQGGPFNTLTMWGPYADAQQTAANAQMLAEAIQKSVDPNCWKDTGKGAGTISFHYPTMTLIVRAPSEVHAELYDKMNPPVK